MKTLLELDVTPEEMAAVTDVLRNMNITFRTQPNQLGSLHAGWVGGRNP